jgi:transposase
MDFMRGFIPTRWESVTKLKPEQARTEGSADLWSDGYEPRLRIKAHPDAWGAEKNGPQAIGKTRGGWNTKLHAVTAGDRLAVRFSLSAGNAADAAEGRLLLETIGKPEHTVNLLTDRAYEEDRTRLTAWELRFNPAAPPKKNRVKPWDCDRKPYKQRKERERFFRRIKGFRGICARYDKLDIMLTAFIYWQRRV